MRWRYGLLVALILLALSPLLWSLLSGGLANLAGCEISPAHDAPCPILGMDWAPAMRFGLVSGWLGIYAVPAAFGLLLILVLMALFDLVRYLLRR